MKVLLLSLILLVAGWATAQVSINSGSVPGGVAVSSTSVAVGSGFGPGVAVDVSNPFAPSVTIDTGNN